MVQGAPAKVSFFERALRMKRSRSQWHLAEVLRASAKELKCPLTRLSVRAGSHSANSHGQLGPQGIAQSTLFFLFPGLTEGACK